jgi:hypothetical protein
MVLGRVFVVELATEGDQLGIGGIRGGYGSGNGQRRQRGDGSQGSTTI